VRQQAVSRAEPPILPSVRNRPDPPLRLAIVIPAYCEEEGLGPVLHGIPDLGPAFERRVFVVDDGSTDGTAETVRRAGATLVRHAQNLGIGAALTTGFVAALTWGADLIVMMDADGQHDPALLAALVAPIVAGRADLVLGSRFRSDASGFPNLRRVGVMAYTRLIRVLSGYDLTDVTTGYRAFRASVYPRLSFRAHKNWAIEMTLRAGLNDVRMQEISAPHRDRCGGHSQFDRSRLFLQYHGRALLQLARAYASKLSPPGRWWSPPTPMRLPRAFSRAGLDGHDGAARPPGERTMVDH